MNAEELPDSDLEQQLGTGALCGPRSFGGRNLGRYSLNAAGLVAKVLGIQAACEISDAMSELQQFPAARNLIEHDFVFLEILADAFCEKEDPISKALVYRRLLSATDDPFGYRARVAVRMESATESDRKEARRLVQEILGEVDAARVELEKKTSPAASPEPPPTTTPLASGRARAKRAGRSTTSVGK